MSSVRGSPSSKVVLNAFKLKFPHDDCRRVIHEIVYAYATPSVDREVVKELAAQAREFGVRVTRTWSHLSTHYLLDQIPEQEDGVPAVYPIEMLCGLLNGSHFVTLSWLKEFLAKAKLPRGSGNLEEDYNPPKAEDFKLTGPLSELWQPSDNRQGLFKDVNFVILYDGSEVSVVSARSFT